MKLYPGVKLDRIISIGALSLSIASMICLTIVFAGCTSASAPSDLYFMKVNFSKFPDLDNFHIRRSLNLGEVDNSSGATSVIDSASNTTESGIDEASSVAETVVSHTKNHFETLSNELESNIPKYYSLGLWGYCKEKRNHTSCSKPSVSFSFDLSAIFNTISSDLGDLLPDINKKALHGYRKLSHAIIWLYIFGFTATAFSVIFAVRTVFFSAGSKLLVISCMLSAILTTAATTGITVIYGLFTAGIKSTLQEFGAQVVLGPHMFIATWLAVAFSIASLLSRLIQAFCCCI